MKKTWTFGLGAVLAFASTGAFAFQEQQAGSPPQAAPPAQVAPATDDPVLGMSGQDTAKSAGGTEVSIPGLGKVGVLPKMDFGLELLYGAADQKQPELPQEDNFDDLTVRGTLKHKF